jgi:hypothetical protein
MKAPEKSDSRSGTRNAFRDSPIQNAIDTGKIDEAVLALLVLKSFGDGPITRAWKGHDWECLNRLYEAGFITDPRTKNKSIVFTEDGLQRARECFDRLFSKG